MNQPLNGYGRCPSCGENYSAMEGVYECFECEAEPEESDDETL